MRIINARVIDGWEGDKLAGVVISGETISEVVEQESMLSAQVGDTDARGMVLAPGLIDLHNHGALGRDSMERDPQHWREWRLFLARNGVTGFLPTSTSASREELESYLTFVGEHMAEDTGGARILGAHLEGPYLNPDLCGMHPHAQCRNPEREEYESWLKSGVLKRITLAPELPESKECLQTLTAAGVLVSAGHSAITPEALTQYADDGLKHVTHLYNAMSRAEKVGPIRECGLLESSLADDRLVCEIIADGLHVPELLFRVAMSCKGADGITITSDATPITGTEGEYITYGGSQALKARVRDGMATSVDGSMLVGSIQTLGEMFGRVLDWLDGDWISAVKLCSSNSARMLGLEDKYGHIAPGYAADLVLFDKEGMVQRVWIGGKDINNL